MKYLITALALMISAVGYTQSVLPLRADTVRIEKVGGSGELQIRNATRDSIGVMVNIGGGRTRFMKVKKSGDTAIIIGLDTISIAGKVTLQQAINNGNVLNKHDTILNPIQLDILAVETPNGRVGAKFMGIDGSLEMVGNGSESFNALIKFRDLTNPSQNSFIGSLDGSNIEAGSFPDPALGQAHFRAAPNAAELTHSKFPKASIIKANIDSTVIDPGISSLLGLLIRHLPAGGTADDSVLVITSQDQVKRRAASSFGAGGDSIIINNIGTGENLFFLKEDTAYIKRIRINGNANIETDPDSSLVINIPSDQFKWDISGNDGLDSAANFLGTLNNAPVNFRTNGIVRGILSSAGNFGVGTSAPPNLFTVSGSSSISSVSLLLNRFGGVAGGSIFGRHSRGTESVPTATQLGDNLLFFGGLGYGSSQYTVSSVAAISMTAAANFSNTSNPTELNFFTTPTGSVTRSQRAIVKSDGKIGIGTTVPFSLLTVASNNTTSNIMTYVYGSSVGPGFVSRQSRGTDLSPSATLTNDTLGGVSGNGYGTSAFHTNSTGLIAFVAEENFTNSTGATKMLFFTTPTGSVIKQLRASISSTGQFAINSLAGTGERITSASSTGQLGTITVGSGLSFTGGVLSATNVTSTTYTPTLTSVTNLDAVSSVSLGYYVTGTNILEPSITVYGEVTIDPTAAGQVQFRISLPSGWASAFINVGDAAGTAADDNEESFRIKADTVNDQLLVSGNASNLGSHTISIHATYRMIFP